MSKYLIAILLSAWSISLRAQVAEKLQQLGMENIQTVTEVNGNTTIAFEDNVYRGTYRGIGKAIEAAMEGMYGGNLQMVVLEHSIPQLCITLSDKVITEYKEKQITIGEVYRQMGISYDTDEAMEVLKKTHRTLNSSAGKVDIVVYPEVKLENSSFDRLYTYYVNLAPAVEMALWKIIPPEEGNDLCHRLVNHGRDVCTARTKPYCDRCCLNDICEKNGVDSQE